MGFGNAGAPRGLRNPPQGPEGRGSGDLDETSAPSPLATQLNGNGQDVVIFHLLWAVGVSPAPQHYVTLFHQKKEKEMGRRRRIKWGVFHLSLSLSSHFLSLHLLPPPPHPATLRLFFPGKTDSSRVESCRKNPETKEDRPQTERK